MLRRIGNQLGKLLKIDARTVDSERGRYARLCVQIDLDQPLTPKVRIDDILWCVQYEGVSTICFECGYVGHKLAVCPTITAALKHLEKPIVTVAPPSTDIVENSKYGEWMLVSGKKPVLGRKKINSSTQEAQANSHVATVHAQANPSASTVHGGSTKAGKFSQIKSNSAHPETHWSPPSLLYTLVQQPTHLHRLLFQMLMCPCALLLTNWQNLLSQSLVQKDKKKDTILILPDIGSSAATDETSDLQKLAPLHINSEYQQRHPSKD
jgi:hypothetical protein